MKEPTTIKEAKQLTLDKIKRCMELPIGKREDYWCKTRWPKHKYTMRYCAFCIVADWVSSLGYPSCECIVQDICQWYVANVDDLYFKKDLRKLYKMVEAI